jgi:hypothetical protein
MKKYKVSVVWPGVRGQGKLTENFDDVTGRDRRPGLPQEDVTGGNECGVSTGEGVSASWR